VTRLSWIASIGLLACNTDVGKQVAAPRASTPPAHVPVAPASAPPVASAAADSDAGASGARREGQPDCRFERPTAWTSGHLSWLGSCRNGYAQGNGVIVREFDQDLGLEPKHFYGRLQDGYLSVGVLEGPGGYRAGTWVRGALAPALPDDMAQRNVQINAFDVAAAAATAVSESFANQGDAKSSRFYSDKARQLAEQID
jgi:hypothetical protein